MGDSKNRGTPKSSILIGFSIINHPFWGTPIFGNTRILKGSVEDGLASGLYQVVPDKPPTKKLQVFLGASKLPKLHLSHEQKPSYLPLYWLINRDAYNGL